VVALVVVEHLTQDFKEDLVVVVEQDQKVLEQQVKDNNQLNQEIQVLMDLEMVVVLVVLVVKMLVLAVALVLLVVVEISLLQVEE
jgi:hypothetical protein